MSVVNNNKVNNKINKEFGDLGYPHASTNDAKTRNST